MNRTHVSTIFAAALSMASAPGFTQDMIESQSDTAGKVMTHAPITPMSSATFDPAKFQRLPAPPGVTHFGYPLSGSPGEPAAYLNCAGPPPGVPRQALASFFDTCAAVAELIVAPVDPEDMLALAGQPFHVVIQPGSILATPNGETICDIHAGIPLPSVGQTVGAFLEKKALCEVFLRGWSSRVEQLPVDAHPLSRNKDHAPLPKK